MNFAEIASSLAVGIWDEFIYILPFIGLGVLLEATIRTLKWHLKIRQALTRFGGLSIILATVLGTVSPLCACATLPLVISLLLAGLPLAPAMALLVASPLMSPAGYTLLNWELGAVWANTVLFCAIALGLFAGYLTHLLRPYGFSEEVIFRKKLPEGNFHDPDYPVAELRCDCGQQLSHRVDRCTHNKWYVFLAKFWEGVLKIGKFALIGITVEVIALQFIPNEWISMLLEGTGIMPIFALTFATIPLHMPQVTAAAMLYGFVSPEFGEGIKLSKGAGIALLVGGPVTALPVMALFIAMFRKRVLALYLAVCISGTLVLALGYRWLPFNF